MPIVLEADIEGERQLSRRMAITADAADDLRPPLQTISGKLLHTFDLNFAGRGSLFGPWPPRKDSNPWPLLERRGDMRRGFRSLVGRDSLTLYNPVAYFKFHQSNQPRTKIPRRVMMKLDNERKEFIQKAFQEYIVSIIRSKRG